MNDKKIINGSDIERIVPYYEQACIYTKNGEAFFITFEHLTEIVKGVSFTTELKRKRSWATPILNPQIFIEDENI
jgi:hypothetical protein